MPDALPDWKTMDKAERLQTVRSLVKEGHPATVIAERFTGATRMSVIGLCSRKHLQLQGRPPKPPAPPRKPKAEKKAKPKVEARISVREVAIARANGPRIEADPDGLLELGNDVTALIGSILDLTEHTCKWPIGDPLKPNFGFCGRHSLEGSPYCAGHDARAHGRVLP